MSTKSSRNSKNHKTSSTNYNSYRNFSDRYYTNTSNAYDYGLRESERAPVKKPRPGTSKKNKKRFFKPKFIFLQNEYKKLSLATRTLVIVFFLGCVGVVFTTSIVSNKKLEINRLQREIKKTEEVNAAIEAENIANYDLKKIEQIASERLGMSKPRAYQIVQLDIKKQQPVTIVETSRKASMFDIITNWFYELWL